MAGQASVPLTTEKTIENKAETKNVKPIAVVRIPVEVSAELRIMGSKHVLVTTDENAQILKLSLTDNTLVKVDGDRPYRLPNFIDEYIKGGRGLHGVLSYTEYDQLTLKAGYDEEQDMAKFVKKQQDAEKRALRPEPLPPRERLMKLGSTSRRIYDLITSGVNTSKKIHENIGGSGSTVSKTVMELKKHSLIESLANPITRGCIYSVLPITSPEEAQKFGVQPSQAPLETKKTDNLQNIESQLFSEPQTSPEALAQSLKNFNLPGVPPKAKHIYKLIESGSNTLKDIKRKIGPETTIESIRNHISLLKQKGYIKSSPKEGNSREKIYSINNLDKMANNLPDRLSPESPRVFEFGKMEMIDKVFCLIVKGVNTPGSIESITGLDPSAEIKQLQEVGYVRPFPVQRQGGDTYLAFFPTKDCTISNRSLIDSMMGIQIPEQPLSISSAQTRYLNSPVLGTKAMQVYNLVKSGVKNANEITDKLNSERDPSSKKITRNSVSIQLTKLSNGGYIKIESKIKMNRNGLMNVYSVTDTDPTSLSKEQAGIVYPTRKQIYDLVKAGFNTIESIIGQIPNVDVQAVYNQLYRLGNNGYVKSANSEKNRKPKMYTVIKDLIEKAPEQINPDTKYAKILVMIHEGNDSYKKIIGKLGKVQYPGNSIQKLKEEKLITETVTGTGHERYKIFALTELAKSLDIIKDVDLCKTQLPVGKAENFQSSLEQKLEEKQFGYYTQSSAHKELSAIGGLAINILGKVASGSDVYGIIENFRLQTGYAQSVMKMFNELNLTDKNGLLSEKGKELINIYKKLDPEKVVALHLGINPKSIGKIIHHVENLRSDLTGDQIQTALISLSLHGEAVQIGDKYTLGVNPTPDTSNNLARYVINTNLQTGDSTILQAYKTVADKFNSGLTFGWLRLDNSQKTEVNNLVKDLEKNMIGAKTLEDIKVAEKKFYASMKKYPISL